MSRVLGVDWGETRIGLALSDESRTLAGTLPTLKVSSDLETVDAILKIVRERDVDTLVVGDPLHMNGEASTSGEKARKMVSLLVNNIPSLIVVFRDERLTSREAESMLLERGEKLKGRKERLDQVAAAIILQNFLDEEG